MPPSGYEPFLRAICESPEEDAPRLVYADWLEEQGGAENVARAEFIRIQIERAKLRAEGADDIYSFQRNSELNSRFGDHWRDDELPRISHVNWQRFWRGFVSGADINTGGTFVRHAEAIFNATPIQFLLIAGLNPDTSEVFAASPLLLRLQGLTISDHQFRIGIGWQAILNSPSLENLRLLTIRGPIRGPLIPGPQRHIIDLQTADLLANAPLLRLESLNIEDFVSPDPAAILRERFGHRVRWYGGWDGGR